MAESENEQPRERPVDTEAAMSLDGDNEARTPASQDDPQPPDQEAEASEAEASGAEEPAGGEASTPSDAGAEGDEGDGSGVDPPEQAEEEVHSTEGQVDPEAEPLVTPGMDWFVLRVASNKEDSVRETLLRKIKIEGFQHLVNRILVPTEKIKTMKGGKQRIVERKLYPGYVFVEMKLEDDGRIPQDVFFLIKETTGVGDFIGTAGRPAPMQAHEVEKMIQAAKRPEDQPEVQMEFERGDQVRIKEGPFENMEGVVDELLPEQGKVRVVVTIFGRATPVEMEYWLVEKPEE